MMKRLAVLLVMVLTLNAAALCLADNQIGYILQKVSDQMTLEDYGEDEN